MKKLKLFEYRKHPRSNLIQLFAVYKYKKCEKITQLFLTDHFVKITKNEVFQKIDGVLSHSDFNLRLLVLVLQPCRAHVKNDVSGVLLVGCDDHRDGIRAKTQ